MEPKIVCLAAICVFLVHNVIAESSKNVSSNNPISTKPPTDELFIDDGLDNPEDSDIDGTMLADDGSGMGPTSKGTGVEDMESSGSGYGPDDEDAEVDVKNKDKTDVDSDQDEDDDDEDDDDEDDEEIKQDLNKEKIQKNKAAATTPTTTTTSTTTTTTENYDENSRIIDLPKQKTNVDEDINVPPEVTQITSTSTLPPPPPNAIDDHSSINGVYISPNNHPERTSSFFAQPGILAAVIGGAVVGLLCAILVVMFIVYRMRKKDEGSYPLEETKRSPATNPYLKSTHREFYA